MNHKTTFGVLLLFFSLFCQGIAQPGFTANDQVPAYNQFFRYGSNFGNYPPWSNNQVADIAAGEQGLYQEGIGLKAHRPAMPEFFFEDWGYDIRVADFEHFDALDIRENVAFIGYPSEEHRENTMHCPDIQSEVFANLFEPIWDNGENDTPVNEDNYFAIYVYKMVNQYKDYVRFWEVWNEPDFTTEEISWAPAGEPGNWWENNPDPCHNHIKAPISHYIRMLRISYEVIKSIDPSAYVCTGGIGNPAFLHSILRNTDNPEGGISADYPNFGGAYFDVLSFHSYPHIDGSMLEWVNGVGLVWHRHSDRGIDGLTARKLAFESVLDEFGYNGNDFPEKLWVLSETNLPRKVYQSYIGSENAQRNYMIKSFIEAQKLDILQVDVFTISELENEANAWNEYQLMGVFKNLSDYSYPNHQITDAGIAFKTTSNLLYGKRYDAGQTAAMNLPESINGAAFKGSDDEFVYVLWAKTSEDNSENAEATYSFPASFNLQDLSMATWDYGLTQDTTVINSNNIALNGAPVFLAREFIQENPVSVAEVEPSSIEAHVFPNPFQEHIYLTLNLQETQEINVSFFNSAGSKISTLLEEQNLSIGKHDFDFEINDLPKGLYWLNIQSAQGVITKKLIAN